MKTDVMEQIVGAPLARALAVMEFADAAEEEIRHARLNKATGSVVFQNACPPAVLWTKGVDLYRRHVRELIARAKAGHDMLPGTDAECLAAMLDTATVAPLNRAGQAVAEQLFSRVYPEKIEALLGSTLAQPTHEGQIEEDVAQLRKKLARTR